MVSMTSQILAAAAVVATALTTSPVESLAIGEYFRPTGGADVVSSVPGTTAPFRRSPCPGLNSLANHGYLPRNGQNISHAELSHALVSVFNLDPKLAGFLIGSQISPNPFDLDYLSTHDVTEHDVSLVHEDVYFGKMPHAINISMVADFLARADSTGRIGAEAVGKTRKDRLATCRATNPTCAISVAQTRTALGEGAALIGVMGGMLNASVSVEHAYSFLVMEQIPVDYKKAASPIVPADLGKFSASIAAYTV